MIMNANDNAFPSIDVEYQQGCPTTVYSHGLTKHEYFAARAMQGLLSNSNVIDSFDDKAAGWIARHSVTMADTLIAALNEEKKL